MLVLNSKFLVDLFMSFAVAFGVVVGGSLLGSLASLLTGGLPMQTMQTLAERLKVWAAVAAIGGTFFIIRTIESSLFEGQIKTVIRQVLFILSAFIGAQFAFIIIREIAQ